MKEVKEIFDGVTVINTIVVVIDLKKNGSLGKFGEVLKHVTVECGSREILFAWTNERGEAVIVLEPNVE